MTGEHDHDDLAREIRAIRAEPRPEFARELDERAAGWLREPRLRWFRSPFALRAVAAAASAAALVVALVIASGDGDGGENLEVAVVVEGAPGGGGTRGTAPAPAAPEALQDAAPQRDSSQGAAGGAFLLPAVEADAVTVRYLFPQATTANVALAGRDADVTIGPGAGSLEISTEGLRAGSHELTISTPAAPTYRHPVRIDG